MIPRRIALTGFLCYRDEQVIDLDGCELWVFSGRNGSGKSSIFDAITFALFDAHRGGQQKAENLIHTDATELSVVFDFDLGPARYRITRKLRRGGTSDRQLYRFEPEDGGCGRWPAVPETHSKQGLSRWVQENIGLTFETFTASVLLMQGKAENLLSAQPKARFEILAGVVDLARYQRLHDRAEKRRQNARSLAETFRTQLRGAAEVDPAAVQAALDRLEATDQARTAAEREWKRLHEVEAQAKSWSDLRARCDDADRKRADARRLLDDSDSIARDWGRLQELDAVLPALREAAARRESFQHFESEAQRYEDERAALARKLDLMTSLAEDNRRHLDSIVEEIARDEVRQRSILERQTALQAPIQRAATARRYRDEVARLERSLAADPEDLEIVVTQLEADFRDRAEWRTALPSLKTLARERAELARARQRIVEIQGKVAAGDAEVHWLEALGETALAEEAAARQAEHEARDRLAVSADHRRSVGARLDQFRGLKGVPTCDRCGQPLTEAHFAAETTRLRDELDRATSAFETDDQTFAAAKARHSSARTARAEADRTLQETRSALSVTRRDLDHAEADERRRRSACEDAYGHLAEPFRGRVAPALPADWLETTFPNPDDLAEGRRLEAGLSELQAALEETRKGRDAKRDEKAYLAQARQSLAAIGLEAGDDDAEERHAALAAELAAIDRCLKGHATERSLAQETFRTLESQARALSVRLNETTNRQTAGRSRAEALAEEMARARAAIPEPWFVVFDTAAAADLEVYDTEGQALRAKGTEALARALPEAELRHRQALSDLDTLDGELARIPEEARLDPALIAERKQQAAKRLDAAGKDLRDRQGELDTLRRAAERRQALEAQTREAEAAHATAETLARLLGRDGLQRHLLREAEHGIVDRANPILREVSGGEIELRVLEGDDDPDHALPLEALVRTHGQVRRINVAFLSGSQRFRVAVSLALAIGQFARGIQRPIEAVIIDEGFGCLDRQGRDEMIAELGKLKDRLARVVLVSHQDEFAEAFNDGYRFEVVEGSTVVQPFHR